MSINTEEDTPNSTDILNKETITEEHKIGDSLETKPAGSHPSLDNFIDITCVSSHDSCAAYKTICNALKKRCKNSSNISLQTNVDPAEENYEELATNSSSKELANTLSLSVVMESRTLLFTESSEDVGVAAASVNDLIVSQRLLNPEEIQEAFVIFKSCDNNYDGLIDMNELKFALEKLSVPQTHLGIKGVILEVLGKGVIQLNFCQFLLTYAAILQNRAPGTNLITDSPCNRKVLNECVNVSEVGVTGAKQFFEAKIARQTLDKISK